MVGRIVTREEGCHHAGMPVELTTRDRDALDGAQGEGVALAMRIVVELANALGAEHLLDIESAHVDGCLYHGQAGLDFVQRLVKGEARVKVPTTLNVSALDLLHPELVRLDRETTDAARAQMDAYVALGCRPTWTCAPYQLEERPRLGAHVAWAESNAIVFANSVLGARTDRYGDFIDICAAVTGRAPAAGLHLDANRRARVVVRPSGLSDRLLREPAGAAALGHVVGKEAGTAVPAIVGLPADISEDALKALGAAAASSGSVGMFHGVGITPEAPTLEAALAGRAPQREVDVSIEDLRAARDELGPADEGAAIAGVCVGTPHASGGELARLSRLIGEHGAPTVPFYVNTGRDVLSAAGDVARTLVDSGVSIVTDTCTYLTPILHDVGGPVMTDSAKWAWYAPANLGIRVVFGPLEDCVRSAAAGRVTRDLELWG
jgi:predicted aconitase